MLKRAIIWKNSVKNTGKPAAKLEWSVSHICPFGSLLVIFEALLTSLTNQLLYTDHELFHRIAEGDERAFELLFKKYVKEMEPVILRLVKSPEVVKDIIHDIFLGLWLGRERLDAVEQPSSWLYRLLYNRTYGWLEKQSTRRELDAQKGVTSALSNLNDTEQRVAFREVNRLVLEAVDQLPAQTKKIYELSREQGLKQTEIADQLGLSLQTVKNTLTNAGKSIKSYLAQHDIHVPLVLVLYIVG